MKIKNIYLITMIIISLLSLFYIKRFSYETQNTISKYTKNESFNKMNYIIDNVTKEILSKESCNGIIITLNNELNFDNDKINKVLNKISKELNNELNNKINKNDIYHLVYGPLSKYHIVANLGPSIPYSVKTVGNVKINSKINVKEYGINNSLIEVKILIEIQFEVILPFIEETYKLEKEIILDSKIINGEIPLYYADN